MSEHRVCGLMGMAVSSCRYEPRRSDEALRTHLVGLAREKPRFGYRRLLVLPRRSGETTTHKRVHRVHRVYREAGLTIRRKKRKYCVRAGRPLVVRTSANQEWALDFVHDAVESGRMIRVLSVVDAYTREYLASEVGTSFDSRRVEASIGGDCGEAWSAAGCSAQTGIAFSFHRISETLLNPPFGFSCTYNALDRYLCAVSPSFDVCRRFRIPLSGSHWSFWQRTRTRDTGNAIEANAAAASCSLRPCWSRCVLFVFFAIRCRSISPTFPTLLKTVHAGLLIVKLS